MSTEPNMQKKSNAQISANSCLWLAMVLWLLGTVTIGGGVIFHSVAILCSFPAVILGPLKQRIVGLIVFTLALYGFYFTYPEYRDFFRINSSIIIKTQRERFFKHSNSLI